MRSALLYTVALALVACNCWALPAKDTRTSAKVGNFFVETLEKLHRGPPVPLSKSRAAVQEEWIVQKLDHFDENENRTWQMRYLVNDEHFKEGGPIFIYVGGEWTVSAGSILGGHFWDMAKEHKGILFYTEHRYYGYSKPTSDRTVDNLKYLHVRQALADLAHFIHLKRESVPALANSKVIMAGGSYAATMVVWFKREYPELLAGGWASSAPLLAKADFSEYKEVTGQAMRDLGSQQCYDRIKNGVAELESMFANRRGAEVKAMMKLCNNFNEDNDLDLWSLFSTISNVFAGIVQYQSKGDIPTVCSELMKYEDDATAIAGFLITATGSSRCIDVAYKSDLEYLMDSTYESGEYRSWLYQTCNEYGWYQTSRSVNQPFGTKFPLALNIQLCSDIYGEVYSNENINKNIAQTNAHFGGMAPEVDNVYMTHGALDPWSPMGHGREEGATVIPEASHCNDFSSISKSDSAPMVASKQRIAELVRVWLAE